MTDDDGRPVAVGRLALLTVVAAVVAVGAVTLVGAHGNHVDASPQVVTDEGLLVESTFVSQDGHLVVHRSDDGEPGEAIGHVSVGEGYHENVRVGLDAMPDGEQRLWLVLHEDDGDGEFTPGDDPPIESFGSVAGSQITVRSGEQPVYISAPGEASQSVADGTVTIDQVAADADGRVLVQTVQGREPGDVIGSASVSDGVSDNVTVDLDQSFLDEQPEYFGVYVTLADGDGEAVSVGGDAVRTRLSLTKAGDDSSDVGVVTEGATDDGDTGADGESDDGLLAQPGFGLLLAVGVVAALLAVGLRGRR